ncbi:UNVERIFIED_CONTAM: hypothetical protein HDU68_005064 [Siphonaria sp. JEL0065]|nr:hypothetical protein HDU68_005064 [Siphonaria sp. JEL0065]
MATAIPARTPSGGHTPSLPVETPTEHDGFPPTFGLTANTPKKRGNRASTSTTTTTMTTSTRTRKGSDVGSVSTGTGTIVGSASPNINWFSASFNERSQSNEQEQQPHGQAEPDNNNNQQPQSQSQPQAQQPQHQASQAQAQHQHQHQQQTQSVRQASAASAARVSRLSQQQQQHQQQQTSSFSSDSEASSPTVSSATSTAFQATINSSNVMLGMGILTLPYGLHISGWILGLVMISTFAFVAQYTAKLLVKCMQVPFPRADSSETTPLLNPHRHRALHQNSNTARLPTSLSDVVELAFGPASRPFISFLFIFELFAAATGLVILGADSIVAMVPSLSVLPVKIAVTAFLVLTTMPRGMGWLAYGSVVGLLTLLSLFGILLFNGLSTPTTPGSLWQAAPTNLWPEETSAFGEEKSMWLAAGLFCIGLDAHAVFPSIYRDLKTPTEFGNVVERSYILNWGLYVGFASAGYIMFGTDILPQVTQNFPFIPTFNQNLTKFILVLTALNPLTKYALIMAPVNFQMEQILGIPNLSLPQSQIFTPFHGILVRVFLGICAILTTIMFPTFHVLIGLVGSLFSFMIAGVLPALCYLRLGTGNGYRQEGIVESCRISKMEIVACVLVVGGSVCLGALGTVASIYSH